ncbi:MAG: beta-hexosaminidase, partial [Enterococcus sp.]|nr:beta-hexosaminidase [Enterococcus sp.]
MKKTLFVCFLSLLFSLSACVKSDETTNSSSFTESSTTHSSSQTSTTKSSVVESTQTETDWIQEKITTMTLAEKVGQLFLARFPGEQALNDSQTYNLGGFILFGTDVVNENKDSLIEKIQNLQAEQKIPLFFASDEEGGTVTRISMNPNLVEARFLSPQAIYQEQGWEGIVQDTQEKAAILADLGFQFGMFPVTDVATNPQAFIYERTIG